MKWRKKEEKKRGKWGKEKIGGKGSIAETTSVRTGRRQAALGPSRTAYELTDLHIQFMIPCGSLLLL